MKTICTEFEGARQHLQLQDTMNVTITNDVIATILIHISINHSQHVMGDQYRCYFIVPGMNLIVTII